MKLQQLDVVRTKFGTVAVVEAKRVDPNHTYKVGIVSRCATAYGQMLGRIRERRAGITSEITHHSGVKFN